MIPSRSRAFATALLVLACGFPGATYAAPPSIWKKGVGVGGTCRAVVAGKTLMDGPCAGLGHGDSVFVTAEKDGCSIDLKKSAKGVVGTISEYRNTCGDLENEVGLGTFKLEGGCWKSASAEVCLEPRR